MKKRSVFKSLFCALLLTGGTLCAQSDAFFYEKYEQRNEELVSMTTGMTPAGLNFGGFLVDEEGTYFGDFEFEDAPLGNGLLLLCGMAVLRLRRKNHDN